MKTGASTSTARPAAGSPIRGLGGSPSRPGLDSAARAPRRGLAGSARPREGPLFFLVATLFSHAHAADERASYPGTQLPDADGLYERWDPKRSWATSYTVAVLEAVAERVAFELPLADPLLIGDISRQGGGRLDGHVTHDRGNDVDIGLFMDDGRQPLGGFVELRASQLDVASTWVLLRELLDTGQVQFVLLDQGHIHRLRTYALEEIGLDRDTVDAIFPPRDDSPSWREKGVVRHAPNHRSHLHVRLLPPETDDATATPSWGPRPTPAAPDAL